MIKYKTDHTAHFNKDDNIYSYVVLDKQTREVKHESKEYPSTLFNAILDAANKIREVDKI